MSTKPTLGAFCNNDFIAPPPLKLVAWQRNNVNYRPPSLSPEAKQTFSISLSFLPFSQFFPLLLLEGDNIFYQAWQFFSITGLCPLYRPLFFSAFPTTVHTFTKKICNLADCDYLVYWLMEYTWNNIHENRRRFFL